MHFILSFKYNKIHIILKKVLTTLIKFGVVDSISLSVSNMMYHNGMNSTKKTKKEP